MTQTIEQATTATRVRMPQTVGYLRYGTVRLYLYDLVSVAEAREEFGPTIADARSFVGNVTCQVCGLAACELRECFECGFQGCDCLISSGDHDDQDWCPDCARTCYGPCCSED